MNYSITFLSLSRVKDTLINTAPTTSFRSFQFSRISVSKSVNKLFVFNSNNQNIAFSNSVFQNSYQRVITSGGLIIADKNYTNKLKATPNTNVEITNCRFSKCVDLGYQGGAIYIKDSALKCSHCSFVHCMAQQGGAIYVETTLKYDLFISDSCFMNCTATNKFETVLLITNSIAGINNTVVFSALCYDDSIKHPSAAFSLHFSSAGQQVNYINSTDNYIQMQASLCSFTNPGATINVNYCQVINNTVISFFHHIFTLKDVKDRQVAFLRNCIIVSNNFSFIPITVYSSKNGRMNVTLLGCYFKSNVVAVNSIQYASSLILNITKSYFDVDPRQIFRYKEYNFTQKSKVTYKPQDIQATVDIYNDFISGYCDIDYFADVSLKSKLPIGRTISIALGILAIIIIIALGVQWLISARKKKRDYKIWVESNSSPSVL